MKILLLFFALFIPLPAISGGLLGEATQDLAKVGTDKSLSRDSSLLLERAAYRIERAELAQSVQVETLTKRIVELESTVLRQKDLISKYQQVVAELEAKIGK